MFQVFGRERQALVEKLPVEGAARTLVLSTVRERLEVDDVNERTNHRPIVSSNRVYTHTHNTNGK